MSFFRHFLQILLDTFEIWTLKKTLVYASKICILLINKGFQWWAVGATALKKQSGGLFLAQSGSKLVCGLAPTGVELVRAAGNKKIAEAIDMVSCQGLAWSGATSSITPTRRARSLDLPRVRLTTVSENQRFSSRWQ